MQVCTSLQTDTTPAPHCSVFYRLDALPATQPTASKHYGLNGLKREMSQRPQGVGHSFPVRKTDEHPVYSPVCVTTIDINK